MATAIKDAIRKPLLIVALANLAAFYIVLSADGALGGDFAEVSRAWLRGLPAVLGLPLIGILTSQIDSEMKARLVFLRWRDPLPGCRAFSKHAKGDARIDLGALKRAVKPWPTSARQQNAAWYKLFKSVETRAEIAHLHREYLFARDYAFMATVFAVVLGAAALAEFANGWSAAGYIAALILQFVLTSRAARAHGIRLVTTVLALVGAGQRRK